MLFEQGNGRQLRYRGSGMVFAQCLRPGPIPYTNGTGSFSGYWDTLSVKYADVHETLIYWDIYVCWTGVVAGAHSEISEELPIMY